MIKLFIALIVLASCAHSERVAGVAERASYYRVWQGFKRADLSGEAFASSLPSFMQSTVQLYGRSALNQYVVVIPPAEKPVVVPDEFALIALSDEAAYQNIRGTSEGRAYGESHWKIFERSNSKSAFMVVGLPDALKSGIAYDLTDGALDWSKGVTYFYLGTRKESISPSQFLTRLRAHVAMTSRVLTPVGMRGYIVIADDNYEAAYMNWESAAAMTKAFAKGGVGEPIGADSRTFMDSLMWTEALPFSTVVKPSTVYRAY